MKNRNIGRKPKPTNLHILHGTYDASRHRDRADDIKPKLFNYDQEPPEELSEAGRAHWYSVLASLAEANILAEMDRDGVVLYCESWARWAEANEKVARFGMVVVSPIDNKTPVVSPYFSVALKMTEQLRRMLTSYGMTPAARIGLRAEHKHELKPEAGTFAAWSQSRER